MIGYPVVPPSETPASLVSNTILDLTTSRQQFAYPTGAKWVALSYRLLPGATAVAHQYAKVVLNATSDADATGKLALDGGFISLCQGDDIVFAAEGITRIDVIASAAVGTEKTLFRICVGV
jgi:hypothetical protein